MTEEMLNDLIELFEAVIEKNKTEQRTDVDYYRFLKDNFVANWCE